MLNHALLMLAVAAGTAQSAPPGSRADESKPLLPDPATLPADERVTAPAAAVPDQPEPAAGAVRASGFTLDTPIAELIADAGARSVLDRDLPGLSEDANLARFQAMSLREFQPLTGGQLDAALLAKVGSDLAAVVSGAGTDGRPAKRLTEGR